MSEENIFEIFQGMINVQYAYWSKDSKAVVPLDDPGVIVYGKVNNDNPLFFHVRVQDLFIKSNKGWRIHDKTTIHVDLLSIHHSMYQTLQIKEDFENLADYVELLHSLKLNFTEDKKIEIGEGEKIDGYKLDSTVIGLTSAAAPAYLTKAPSRNSATALNAFEYDISFEFKPDEALNKKLFTESALRKNVFAWVWVAHETSKDEYKTHFNIDITDPQKRYEFLKDPDRNFFSAIDILKSPFRKDKHYTRSQLYMKKFEDGFPYDEQSMNYVEISQCLPYKSFSIGAQMGTVGISTMDTQYFDRHVHDHRSYTSTFLVDNKPSMHCKLDTDENFQPDRGADRGVVLHGLKSKLNEFYSRADNRFFFREKSVSHWVNSLEKDYSGSMYDNGMSTVFTKAKYPFSKSKGKLEIFTHDFVKDYKSDNELLQRYTGSDRFIEQKTIDLSSFESVHIAPSGEIKSDDGSFFVRIGKGFPGQEQFIDTIHSKVLFKDDLDNDTWQAHAVCQRPLVITYELDRDLTSEELQLLEKNPIQLLFWIGKPEKKTAVKYQLKIDYSMASSKGSHAILLYLLTNEFKIEVSIDESGIVPAENSIMRDGAAARLFDCSCSLLKNFKYYTPENTGLFSDNPIIVVDDFQEDEVKIKALAKIRKEYNTSMNNAGVKFVLGFVPGVAGEFLNSGWEAFSEWQGNGKVTKETFKKLCEDGLKLLLKDAMKKKDTEGQLEGGVYNANDKVPEAVNKHTSSAQANIKKTLKFAAEISSISTKYIESSSLVSSPFFDGAGFGDKPKSDSLYLLAVGVKDFITDPKTLVTTLISSKGNFAFFKNREIVKDGRSPFNYQFGDTGGLLAREKTDPDDSIASFRVDFQEKLVAFKEAFSKEQAVTLPDYLKKLASGTLGEKFTDIMKNIGANPTLISYFESNGLAQKFKKGLTDAASLTDDERVALTTFLNLVMYIDASFAFCPACGSIVSLSWGWCPYHATREFMENKNIQDLNNDGNLKKEFVDYVTRKLGNPGIAKLLNNAPERDRLLVHWTEFIIS